MFEICKMACTEAKKRNITVSCDLNYRAKLWSRNAARESMSQLCQFVDVCIANEEDAKNVFGVSINETDVVSGMINKAGYQEAARRLRDMFDFRYVAFSLRTSYSASVNNWTGALLDGENYYHSKEYHIDHIVDRVGGGDSFSAGLIYGIHRGFDSQHSIEFAVAASALKHSIEGDYNRICVDEIEKLTGGDTSGRIQR